MACPCGRGAAGEPGEPPPATAEVELRVAVVGAGPGGLALANYLARGRSAGSKLLLTVFERRPAPAGPDGGALLLRGEALEVLDELGLGGLLRSAAGLAAWDPEGTPVMRDALVELLLGRLKEQPGVVEVKTNTEVVDVRETADSVVLEYRPLLVLSGGTTWVKNTTRSGEHATFDMVVGADGNAPSSAVARSIVGQGCQAEPLPLLMMQAALPREAPCQGCQEELSVEGAVGARVEVAPAIGLASGSLGAGTAAQLQWWSVCSLTARLREPAMRSFPKPDAWGSTLSGYLLRASGDGLRAAAGELVDDVARARDPSLGRLHAWLPFHKDDLGHWRTTSGRTLVLGDAAHLMPPTLGWGAGCAMGDARCLAARLLEAAPRCRGQSLSEALGDLDEYVHARRSTVAPLVAASVAECSRLLATGEAPRSS